VTVTTALTGTTTDPDSPSWSTTTSAMMDEAAGLARIVQSNLGAMMPLLGEIDRRAGWRTDGATSLGNWLAQRCGVSETTGRVWAAVAKRLWDLPATAQALQNGELSFDKVQALVRLSTPETDIEGVALAKEYSVRQLYDLLRAKEAADPKPSDPDPDSEQKNRYLHFNDERRTISGQFAREHYALIRSRLERVAKDLPSDGETRWDQRLADALTVICRSGGNDSGSITGTATGGYLVVAHTDLDFLRGSEGSAEIERFGPISRETIERIACDATLILAVDDDKGHTMYEGRAHRDPSPTQRREVFRRDRQCRFPGCPNVTFTNVHHIVPWKPHGRTDLPNLVLLCDHHHHLLHSKQWSMSGNANDTLTFVGPTGRSMMSRPSPVWLRPRK
jgi:hypothetical protein